MVDVIIEKCNEAYLNILAEQSTLHELKDIFTFYAEGYKFHPKYREKLWDGRIFLLKIVSRNKGIIYYGLLQQIIDFCKSREYTYQLKDVIDNNSISNKELVQYVKNLNPSNKGSPIEPRDYQIKGFIDSINNKRNICLSVTSSGKSFIIYMIARYLQDQGLTGLIITPNVSLIHQLYSDFIDYSQLNNWNFDDHIHKIYSGQDKNTKKSICKSTWQSLQNIKDQSWFEHFDYVIVDECFHGETKILTNTGYIEIKNIKQGDIVINYDEDKKIFKEDMVEKLHKNISTNEKLYELEFDNGKLLKVTGNHKFLTKDGWIRADELTENHEIISYE